MSMQTLGLALALLALAGAVISYILLRRELYARLEELRELIQPQPAKAPAPAVSVGQPQSKPVVAPPPPAPKKSKKEPAPPPPKPEIAPEVLAILSAAVAQFLGVGARIRSTRILSAPMGTSPWAQQGRVIIQASHNLAVR